MRKYTLNINGSEKTLGFKPALFSNKHKVYLDDRQIGEFETSKEAKEGKEFRIDHSNYATIKYKNVLMTPEIHVSLNGVELETSANHPKARLNAAFGLMILLTVLNFAIGILGISNKVESITNSGFGFYNLIMGVFYLLALGLFKKSSPFTGIVLTLVVYSIDTANIVANLSSNPGMSGGMVVRIMFYTILIQGLKPGWAEFKSVFKKA